MAENDRPNEERLLDPTLSEDEFIRELLTPLDGDAPEAPEALPGRTIRKIQAELTGRDLIDLSTFVFLMSFCAPLLDLLAAMFGHDSNATSPESGAKAGDPSLAEEPNRSRVRSKDGSQTDD